MFEFQCRQDTLNISLACNRRSARQAIDFLLSGTGSEIFAPSLVNKVTADIKAYTWTCSDGLGGGFDWWGVSLLDRVDSALKSAWSVDDSRFSQLMMTTYYQMTRPDRFSLSGAFSVAYRDGDDLEEVLAFQSGFTREGEAIQLWIETDSVSDRWNEFSTRITFDSFDEIAHIFSSILN